MSIQAQASDLTSRMAGWFFVVFGLGLFCFAAALRSRLVPETPAFVWVLFTVGVVALVFGIVAPRKLRASVLDALVTFLWV
jgi:hypothetical protein